MISVASGFRGGLFFASLFIGALGGKFFAALVALRVAARAGPAGDGAGRDERASVPRSSARRWR